MTTERRFRRFPVKVPLYISAKGAIFQRFVDLQSKDISEGGLAFETSRRIPVEANTRVEISVLSGLPPASRIEGRVVYRKKSRETGRYTIGVSFQNFVNVDRNALRALIEELEDVQATPV